jgi:hypothetical protein
VRKRSYQEDANNALDLVALSYNVEYAEFKDKFCLPLEEETLVNNHSC